jgi:hypothetical protein
LIQCSIPVFEGLFSQDYKELLLDLLFDFNTFHEFTEMQLHTNSTICFLDNSVTLFGNSLNALLDATDAVETEELPQECLNCKRQEAARAVAEGRPVAASRKKMKAFPRDAYMMYPGADIALYICSWSTADQWSTCSVSGSVLVYAH